MAYTLNTNYANKSNYGSKRNTSAIRYIVWHYTANDGDSAANNGKYFANNIVSASAHYFVDDDFVTQSVPDDYIAWSVGGARYSNYKTTGGATYYNKCTNANSLNIELCDTVKDGIYAASEKTLANAIGLTRSLMQTYQIPIENVIRHFDVTGKNCPAYYVDNAKWNEVKEKIAGITTTATAKAPQPTQVSPQKVNITYAVKLEGGRILPEVINLTDYAGIENQRITDIAMKVDKGSVKYQVHILNGSWLPWVTGYNWSDHNNGYAGNGKVIDAIRIYYSTPSDLVQNGGYQEAKYRISPIGSTGYYDWQIDDIVNSAKGMDGYAGAFGKAIDKIQVYIE